VTRPRYLTAAEAAVHYKHKSVKAFYEHLRRMRGTLPRGAVTRRGRTLLIDPIKYDLTLQEQL